MSYFHSDPTRESDPYALPDLEVFYARKGELPSETEGDEPSEAGFYYWACFPGCMPDSDPIGPYDTEAEALDDAREVAP